MSAAICLYLSEGQRLETMMCRTSRSVNLTLQSGEVNVVIIGTSEQLAAVSQEIANGLRAFANQDAYDCGLEVAE
jgi:hypothetical protein